MRATRHPRTPRDPAPSSSPDPRDIAV